MLETNWDSTLCTTCNHLSVTYSDGVLETTPSDGALPSSFSNRLSHTEAFLIVNHAVVAFSIDRNRSVSN